ncbi:META domain-containing protein [Vibrio gallicus]|uniref:META domain-containing protein n=1 Tax=Vibrio gallicus TaxID=190897 RepID=UPI0021C45A25|nr:META domain-containing protein [Vibrio gallicus]
MNKAFVVLSLAALLSACTSKDNSNSNQLTQQTSPEILDATPVNLQHHHWQLTAIDGQPITVMEHFNAPTLEIGENLTANGSAGCNNFFGQAELEDGKLRIEQMGMTMKMCPPEVMDTEMAFSKALTEWNTVVLTSTTLELQNSQHNLTFTLSDWKG